MYAEDDNFSVQNVIHVATKACLVFIHVAMKACLVLAIVVIFDQHKMYILCRNHTMNILEDSMVTFYTFHTL